MYIFGRDTTRKHGSLAAVCREILGSPDPNDRGFTWNLIYEQRVPENWGELWYRKYKEPASPEALRDSLTSYANRMRTDPVDAYADIECEAMNFVRPGLPGSPGLSDSLAHVMDLWSPGARRIWLHGHRQEIGPLTGISGIDVDAPSPPAGLVSVLSRAPWSHKGNS